MNTEKIEIPLSSIPNSGRLVEAYETKHRVIVMYNKHDEIPEEHNCDQMGCGSFSHVKYIFTKPDYPLNP